MSLHELPSGQTVCFRPFGRLHHRAHRGHRVLVHAHVLRAQNRVLLEDAARAQKAAVEVLVLPRLVFGVREELRPIVRVLGARALNEHLLPVHASAPPMPAKHALDVRRSQVASPPLSLAP